MPRQGMPLGVDANTKLLLPFLDASLTDRSGQAGTVTAVSSSGAAVTNARPYLEDGPFGHALLFGSAAGRLSWVKVAQSAAIDISGSLTAECWCYPETPGSELPLFSRVADSGSTNASWDLKVSANGATARVWTSAGTLDTLTLDIPLGRFTPTAPKWTHWRLVFEASTGIRLYADGQLWGYKVTTNANLRTTSLGGLYIGATVVDNAATAQFVGRIAECSVRAVADTSLETLSPNLKPERITRRQLQITHIDLAEHLQADTWTDDGAGGFYRALSGISIGTFAGHPLDIVSVKSKTLSAGVTTTTTFAEVGNVTALDAASNSYFLDLINSRLYSSEDPATPTVFELVVRVPLANHGLVRNFRYYRPAVISAQAGERATAYIDQPMPTAGGGDLKVAKSYSGFPAAFSKEEATSVAWTGSRVFMATVSDGLPWQSMVPDFGGAVDREPTLDSEALSVPLVHDLARLHKVAIELGVLSKATFASLPPQSDGKTLVSPVGGGIRRIPLYCVDAVTPITIATVNYWKYKFSTLPVARVIRWYINGTAYYTATDVDLTNGTIYIPLSTGPQSAAVIEIDVDGLGTAGSPTSTPSTAITLPYGSSNDVAATAGAQIQKLLSHMFGISGTSIGATWTATTARVAGYLRYAEEMTGADTLVELLQRICADSLTHMYVEPSSETIPSLYQWEDVNKADAVDFTLTDGDVISEAFLTSRDNLAAQLNAAAMAYSYDPLTGRLIDTEETSLACTVEAKYASFIRGPWAGGKRGFWSKAECDTWLALLRPMKQSPRTSYEATLSGRYKRVKQFDVISVATTAKPSGVEARHRVFSVHPIANGAVSVLAYPETPYPTDATSTAPTRDAFAPQIRYQWYDKDGSGTVSTVGAWTLLDNYSRTPFMGGWAAIPANVEHKFIVYAQRTGGAGTFKVRLRDVTNSLTIAEATIDTTLAAYTSTTFANIPSGDANLQLEYELTGAATGVVRTAAWWTKETSGNSALTQCGPTLFWSWGYVPGVSVPNSYATTFYGLVHPEGGLIGMNLDLNIPPGTQWRFVAYADGTGTTGMKVGLRGNAYGLGPFASAYSVSITAGAAFYASTTLPTFSGAATVYGITDTGTGTLYAIGIEILNLVP